MIFLYRAGKLDWMNQVELFFTHYFQILNISYIPRETIQVTKFRIALSKLRLSSHRLRVKLGVGRGQIELH